MNRGRLGGKRYFIKGKIGVAAVNNSYIGSNWYQRTATEIEMYQTRLGDKEAKKYTNKFTKDQLDLLKNPEKYTGIAAKKAEEICNNWKAQLKKL